MNIKDMKAKCLIMAAMVAAGCTTRHTPTEFTAEIPTMEPDYAGVTFPPNIAAPSFILHGDAKGYQTEIGRRGEAPSITVESGEDGFVTIPLKQWWQLLESSAGDSLYFRFAMRGADGRWVGAKADVFCAVSTDSIDGYLVYRQLYPGYELWSDIGIYERTLANYDQRAVLENKDFGLQCINCHNFSANNPKQGTMIHVRGKQGGTLISRNGKVEKISSRFQGAAHGATYPCWSRDGRFIAFSANDVGQIFHTAGQKPIEVVDRGADLMVYDVDAHRAYSDSLIEGEEYMETFPCWAPDGKTLYFCRAKAFKANETLPDTVRYSLCAIDFDGNTGRFSNLRTIYAASDSLKSVSFPRVSPDGRWLMFTQSDYGNFSIWHPESQLCIMDLQTGRWREMDEVNSESIESYHSWSSTGRWFVFSSKRLDGLWARPYIASFDPQSGVATKPFALPQKEADFYNRFTRTFNIPELISSPVENVEGLLDGIVSQQAKEVTR